MDILGFDIETVPEHKDAWSDLKDAYVQSRLARYDGDSPTTESIKIQSINPYVGKIICIGVYEESMRYPHGQATEFVEDGFNDEKTLLSNFWDYISGFKGVFVSFNGLSFDVPFIRARSWHHKIPMRSLRFLQLRRFSTDPHFDVMRIFSNWEMPKAAHIVGIL